jgi:hypothetical protein
MTCRPAFTDRAPNRLRRTRKQASRIRGIACHGGADSSGSHHHPRSPVGGRGIGHGILGQAHYGAQPVDEKAPAEALGRYDIGYQGYAGFEQCHPLPVVDGQTVGLEFVDKNAQLAAEYMRGVLAQASKAVG